MILYSERYKAICPVNLKCASRSLIEGFGRNGFRYLSPDKGSLNLLKSAEGLRSLGLREDFITASDVKAKYLISIYERIVKDTTYYKFSFVRNPFDRLVSKYCHSIRFMQEASTCSDLRTHHMFNNSRTRSIPQVLADWGHDRLDVEKFTFKDFLNVVAFTDNHHWSVQTNSWFDFDRLDFVGRYENLETDYFKILKKLGVRGPTQPLKFINVSNKNHYSSFYDDEDINFVYAEYKDDLQKLGYKFEEI